MSPIYTLDFEASCLPQHGRSFPIEVGVAGPDGFAKAWLIKPDPAWDGWTWTPEAEALHGVTREQLARDGLPAEVVLDELRAVLRGQPAYADSYLDARWMRLLEAAAGALPLVDVRHIDALVDRLGIDDAGVARALQAANAGAFRRHRAADDARWLQALVMGFQAEAAPVLVAA